MLDPMDAQQLLYQLSVDPRLAESFFADRERHLVGLEEADREALRKLEPDALQYLAGGMHEEPPVMAEHDTTRTPVWASAALVVWTCGVFTALWLWFGGNG